MNRRRFLKLSLGLGVAALVGCYPVFIERYLVLVNRYKIPVPRLPRPFAGFTLVHLTDLHYGFHMPLAFLEGGVARANRLRGDVIVCTGDYAHHRGRREEVDAVWPVLSRLRAPHGVYSVLGNHDHWADENRSLVWLERNGQGLRHRAARIDREGGRLWIAGAGDLWEDHLDLDRILKNVPPNDCRIVIAHNPDSADTAFREPADLVISGHTHGGQVDIPFYGPPVLQMRNKTYTSGLKMSTKGQPVFISRGIGAAIYPVRFNCFPEIAVLELVQGS